MTCRALRSLLSMLLLLPLTMGITTSIVHCQQQRVKPKPHDLKQWAGQAISVQPNLPKLPIYPIKNCLVIGGQCFPKLKTGSLYIIQMLAFEKPAQVKDWYKGQLKAKDWQIDPQSLTTPTITASREDNNDFINVTVAQGSGRPYKSSIFITYKASKD